MFTLKPLTPYRLLSPNSEGSLFAGDVVWMSKDGTLNIPYDGGFFIPPDEKSEATLDFTAEEAIEFEVVVKRYSESIRRKNRHL